MTSEATVTSRVPALAVSLLIRHIAADGAVDRTAIVCVLSQRQVYKERQAHRREFASLKESHQQAMKLIKSEHQRELHDIQLGKRTHAAARWFSG